MDNSKILTFTTIYQSLNTIHYISHSIKYFLYNFEPIINLKNINIMNTQKTSFNLLNTFLLLLTFSFFTTSTSAQEIWQVDSSIEKMTIERSGEYYIMYVTIKSHNDDDARSPKLIVTLPRNCTVRGITMPKGFESTAYQIFGNESQALKSGSVKYHTDSYINFDLKNLDTRTNETFKISFLPTKEGLRPQSAASAFIYSLTPEASKANNFKSVNIN